MWGVCKALPLQWQQPFLLWSRVSRGEAKWQGRTQDAERGGAVKKSCIGLRTGNSGGEHKVDAIPSSPLCPPKCKVNSVVYKVQGSCLQRSSNIPVSVPFYEVA